MHLKPSRGNNSESMKRWLSFLYATHCHDLFYTTVKYHDYIRVIKLQRDTNMHKKASKGR